MMIKIKFKHLNEWNGKTTKQIGFDREEIIR